MERLMNPKPDDVFEGEETEVSGHGDAILVWDRAVLMIGGDEMFEIL
jgi:hypothetical protein